MFLGQTGFGKTYLAKHFLNQRKYVVVHDGKRTFREKEGLDDWDKVTKFEQAVKSKADKIIYSPERKELRDETAQEYFCEWVLLRGNTTLYVDEGTLFADGQEMPDAAFDIFATGRENGLELWVATQQPVQVPNIMFTQAGAFYVFFHSVADHRRKVRSFVPITDGDVEKLQKEQFYAYGQDWRIPQGPLRLNPDTSTIERIAA